MVSEEHSTTTPESRTKALSRFGVKSRIFMPLSALVVILILSFVAYITGSEVVTVELLFVAILGLMIVVGAGLISARRVDYRLRKIEAVAERVAKGDFRVRIDDGHQDEVGRLARAFNQMIISLDQLQGSRDLLSRTMSPAVRQSLIENGLDFRGIVQDVAILFVDIREFTQITESHHNTEQLVFFLNDYYTTIANQVHSGGGIIGKYAGDSILAYFGAPTPQPISKSATEALLTALALQDAIGELSQRWQLLGLPPIRIGIGISMGPVVAGPVGSEEQFEYTVIGDAVNLASRLQALTRNVRGYSMIISAELYEALEKKIRDQVQVVEFDAYEAMSTAERSKALLRFVDFGEVLVKGRKGPVNVFGIPD